MGSVQVHAQYLILKRAYTHARTHTHDIFLLDMDRIF